MYLETDPILELKCRRVKNRGITKLCERLFTLTL